jgi:hypothetical protein
MRSARSASLAHPYVPGTMVSELLTVPFSRGHGTALLTASFRLTWPTVARFVDPFFVDLLEGVVADVRVRDGDPDPDDCAHKLYLPP